MAVIFRAGWLIVAAAVLVLGGSTARADFLTDEDLAFGRGLVQKGFTDLGVEILESTVGRLEAVDQQRAALTALSTAYEAMARQRRPWLPPAQEQQQRDEFVKKGNDCRDRLAKLGTGGAAGTVDTYVQLVNQARQLQAQIAVEPSADAKKQLGDRMGTMFESAISGLDGLAKKASADLDVLQKKEPDYGTEKHKVWEAEQLKVQERHVQAGVELNRARYAYYKALPASEDKKRQELLTKAADDLSNYAVEYDNFAYMIVGQLTLANAYTDLRKYDEACRAAEMGMQLIGEMMKYDPRAKDSLDPWRNRLLAAWGFATAKQDKYDAAILKLQDITDPEVQVTLAEVLLLKAQKAPAADVARLKDRAKGLLDSVGKIDASWQSRTEGVRQKYGLAGSGYLVAIMELENAVRARDNAGIIRSAGKVLSLGDTVPAAKRALTLKWLAMAYRQEKMYYEGYTVYLDIATSSIGGEDEDTYAGLAVTCLQGQAKETNDPSDGALLDAARKWLRDSFSGPGKEYGEASDAKKKGQYAEAIELFAKVPKDSLYFESAVEQAGECNVLLARQLQKTNPAESERALAKGTAALLQVLEAVKKPSPIPKINDRRKQLKAAAVYRLAAVDLWEGKEAYKACLTRLGDFEKQFPESTTLFPYVSLYRLRSYVALGDLEKAETELQTLKGSLDVDDARRTQQILSYAVDLVFRVYAAKTQALRKEATDLEAQIAKTTDEKKAEELRAALAGKKVQANGYAAKGVEIVKSAIADDPHQPYDRYYYLVYELERLQQFNDLRVYLERFLTEFGATKGLSSQQAKQIEDARLTLGIAHYKCGEYEPAYKTLKERFAVMDAALAAKKKTDPSATPPNEYWVVELYMAKSAKELADKSEKYADEAMTLFLKLRDVLPKDKDDWWDVTVSIAEVQNARDNGYDDNLLNVKRLLMTRKDLGNRETRARYARVLEEIYRRSRKADERDRAIELLVEVQAAEMEQLAKDAKYADMVRILREFRLIAIDYGGKKSRERFRTIAESIEKNAKDAQIIKDAGELIKDLKD